MVTIRRCLPLYSIIALLTASVSTAAKATQHSAQPEDWLARMAEAVEFTNYEGTFVYLSPGKAETFQVFHRVVGEEVTERIVALDGAGAEIIRGAEELICIFPEQQSVVVENRVRSSQDPKGNPLQASIPRYSEQLVELYDLTVMAGDRLLGRPVAVIDIRPRDRYRYGYRLWLDEATAMPLKSQLMGEDESMPLEEIRFTEIRLPAEVPASAVQTQLDTSGYTWKRQNDAETLAQAREEADDSGQQWRAAELPDGFTLQMDTLETDVSGTPRAHLVYSDGLATVSVFVDRAVAASEQIEGFSMMGAANAFTRVQEGLMITAIGEVPPRTVEKIALSTSDGSR